MLNKTAYALLCVAVFAMPWEETVKIVGNSRLPALAGVGALVAGALSIAVTMRMRPLSRFHAVALAFLGWAALALFWTIDPDMTAQRVATYAQLILLVWLIWQFADTPSRQRGLLQAYVAGAYVTAADMIRNYLGGVRYVSAEGYEHESVTSGQFRPNDVAFMLVLAIPIAWYLAVRHGRGILMWVNRLFVPLGFVGVLLTASRGAFIPALFALAIVPLTMGKMRLGTKVMTGVLAVAAIPLVMMVVPDTSWDRLATTRSDLASGTMTHRRDIWRAGFEVFDEHPMLGVGPGTYEVAAGAYLDRPRPAHNAFLAVLVEQGTIGFVLFSALFVVGLPQTRAMTSLERRFWAVLLVTLVIGLLPRNWDYKKPTWFVLGIFAAACGSARARERGEQSPPLRGRFAASRFEPLHPGAIALPAQATTLLDASRS